MRHLMWILTWIAVGIGGVLGAASVILLSGSHHSGASVAPAAAPPREQPVMGARPKTGEPSRSLIVSPYRHSRLAAAGREAEEQEPE